MEATFAEYGEWSEDPIPEPVLQSYQKALEQLEKYKPYEEALVSALLLGSSRKLPHSCSHRCIMPGMGQVWKGRIATNSSEAKSLGCCLNEGYTDWQLCKNKWAVRRKLACFCAALGKNTSCLLLSQAVQLSAVAVLLGRWSLLSVLIPRMPCSLEASYPVSHWSFVEHLDFVFSIFLSTVRKRPN